MGGSDRALVHGFLQRPLEGFGCSGGCVEDASILSIEDGECLMKKSATRIISYHTPATGGDARMRATTSDDIQRDAIQQQ